MNLTVQNFLFGVKERCLLYSVFKGFTQKIKAFTQKRSILGNAYPHKTYMNKEYQPWELELTGTGFLQVKLESVTFRMILLEWGLETMGFYTFFAIQCDSKLPKSCLKGNNLNHLCFSEHSELTMSILKKAFQKHSVMIIKVAELNAENGLCGSINRCQNRSALKIN